jgi:hypothetical protein
MAPYFVDTGSFPADSTWMLGYEALSSIHNPLLRSCPAHVCQLPARHQKGEIRGAEVPTMTDVNFHQDTHDFSLVLGGPVFQLMQKSHLSGSHLELLHRRLLVITLVTWLPLLLLAGLGSLFGSVGWLSFLRDFEVHIRFLIALPALIAAELIVHSRIRPLVHCFVKRRIVSPDDLPGFDSAIESAIRLRNSISVEIALVILVYTFGLWLWNSRVAIESATWYAMPGGCWHLTPAGFWYVFVSPRVAVRTDDRQNAMYACTIGTQPVIPAV